MNRTSKTPYYILREGSHPAIPPVRQISQDSMEIGSTLIYGFSDKPEYDRFLANRELTAIPWTPYPMVKRFLEGQLELNGESLSLVILDAESARQEVLEAATFQAVLSALRMDAVSVPVTHCLILQAATSEYSIEAIAEVDAELSLSSPSRPTPN